MSGPSRQGSPVRPEPIAVFKVSDVNGRAVAQPNEGLSDLAI